MESRSERLKALISANAFTPLPSRPGIHFDQHQAVAALLGMYGQGKLPDAPHLI